MRKYNKLPSILGPWAQAAISMTLGVFLSTVILLYGPTRQLVDQVVARLSSNFFAREVSYPSDEQIIATNIFQIENHTSLQIDEAALRDLNTQVRSFLLQENPELLITNTGNIALVLDSGASLINLQKQYSSQLLENSQSLQMHGATLKQGNTTTIYLATQEEIGRWDSRMTYNNPFFSSTTATGKIILHQTLIHELIHANTKTELMTVEEAEKLAYSLDNKLNNLFSPSVFSL
ncbi:hypothetical protein FWH30_01535 [Microgenomates group bacterium]|nr:hypothetical protein [Microgenomates group bacterium]